MRLLIPWLLFAISLCSCSNNSVETTLTNPDYKKKLHAVNSSFYENLNQLNYQQAKAQLDEWVMLVNSEDERELVQYYFAKATFFSKLKKPKEELIELGKAEQAAKALGDDLLYIQTVGRKFTYLLYRGTEQQSSDYLERMFFYCDSLQNEKICNEYYSAKLISAYKEGNLEDVKNHHLEKGILDADENWASDAADAHKFNYAVMQINHGLLDGALKNFNMLVKKYIETDRIVPLCNAYQQIGKIYVSRNELDSAIFYFQKSEAIGVDVKDYHILSELYSRWSNVENKRKNYAAALALFFKYNDVQDKIFKRAISDNTSLKEQEIKILQKEADLVRLQSNRKQERLILLGALGSLALMSMMLYLIYRSVRNERAVLKELLKNKEDIKRLEDQRLEQEYESKLIKANLNFSDYLHKNISMKLHDELGSALAGLKLKLSVARSNQDEELLEDVVKTLDNAYMYTRNLSHSLRPPDLNDQDFSDFLFNYLDDTIRLIPAEANISIQDEQALNVLPSTLKTEIYRILQELLININKHAEASKVDLQIELKNKRLWIDLEDNGNGMPSNKENTGIGLYNIQQRIEILDGKLDITSKIGEGTRVQIEIPSK